MGIFSSKKKLVNSSKGGTFEVKEEVKRTKKKKGNFGLKKFFSVMFAAPETNRRTYVDVYNRPTFMKSLRYEPGKGYSSVDEDYAARIHGPVKTTGIKRIEYYSYDFDSWAEEEKTKYDLKFKPIELNDEVADTMKIALKELGEDEMEIDEFGNYSEADIKYEEMEVPMAMPDFLPDAIKEETKVKETPMAEEIVVEEVIEVPPVAEETAIETEMADGQPIPLEAPVTAGLLAEPKVEEVKADVVEEPKVETPIVKERNTFSIGFGNVQTEQTGSVTLSFGFGSTETNDEGSAFVSNAVLSSQNVGTDAASF